MRTEEETIVVIGLGETGGPLLWLIDRFQSHVVGVDVDPVDVDGRVGLMHVCYPYDIPEGFVDATVSYAEVYDPEVVVLNSTVIPGTTREVAEGASIPAVYSPIRGKHTRMDEDLLRYTKFVAGEDPEARARVCNHFAALGMKTAAVVQPEILELGKLLETTYFGLLIAWAQEMDRFARRRDGDYYELCKFFEEVDYLPRRIFVPGFIGGHCVIPNIDLLKRDFASPLLDAILDSNERKAAELGEREIGEEAERRLVPLTLDDASK